MIKKFFLNRKLNISILIVLISLFIGFLIIEIAYRQIFIKKNISSEKVTVEEGLVKTMLFQSPDNFINRESIFTYKSNKSIRVSTVFSPRKPKNINELHIEYDYIFETNNEGLVMREDIKKNDSVILIVGDSFTEGQGAIPWFYQLENEYQHSYKIINLGVLGTGPLQWLELINLLINKYDLDVKGVHVNLVLQDLGRNIFNFNQYNLNCLEFQNCEYSGGFQGFDFKKDIREEVMERLNTLAMPRELGLDVNIKDPLKFLKVILRQSVILTKIYRGLQERGVMDIKSLNLNALKKIMSLHKTKSSITIINTRGFKDQTYPTKEQKTILGETMINWAEDNSIVLNWCNPGPNGFHKFDSHPNDVGYSRIKNCVLSAINKFK